MKKLRDFTMNRVGLIVFVGLITAALVDLGLLVFGGVEGTISTWFGNWVQIGSFGVFVWGTVAGHLFFPLIPDEKNPKRFKHHWLSVGAAIVFGAITWEVVRRLL